MPRKKMSVAPTTKSKKPLIIASLFVAVLVFVGIYGFVSVKNEEVKPECVQKNVINNYVCKIVGADPDQDMFAVECLTK